MPATFVTAMTLTFGRSNNLLDAPITWFALFYRTGNKTLKAFTP